MGGNSELVQCINADVLQQSECLVFIYNRWSAGEDLFRNNFVRRAYDTCYYEVLEGG